MQRSSLTQGGSRMRVAAILLFLRSLVLELWVLHYQDLTLVGGSNHLLCCILRLGVPRSWKSRLVLLPVVPPTSSSFPGVPGASDVFVGMHPVD